MQYADFKTYLPGDILTKVDRASMANSLEVRVPLLDHTLVEWAARLPSDLKLHGREGKYVFKDALEPYVSKEILYRPKQGFAVPLATWFRGPLRAACGIPCRGRYCATRVCSTCPRSGFCSISTSRVSATTARHYGRCR